MKKIFTLIAFIGITLSAFANAPTVPSSNFVFTNIEGSKYSVRYTAGNGASRIVVMKAGSPVTGSPVNGTDYAYNLNFGTPAAAFTQPGEFVVWKGNVNSFNVANLLPNTIYYLAVFDFNGTGVTTEYLQVALRGQQSTSVTPSQQISSLTTSNITGNTIRLNWTNGNGERRFVLARKGGAINTVPVDLTSYTANAEFGAGEALNSDNYAIYKGNSNSITISKLEPNTVYHFAVYEHNGSAAPVYKTPGVVISGTTTAGPTVPTTSFSFSNQEGNRFTVTASRGNGSKRLFIARKGAPVTATPVNGQHYNASLLFGSGQEIAPGEFVVNASSESSMTVTNLEPSSTYYFRSFEYDEDSEGNTYYLLTSPATNSYSTASPPSPPTGVNFINVTGNALTIRYTAGNGGNRVVIAKEGAPVNFFPADLARYSSNLSFGSGPMYGDGNYVLNAGANGTSSNITNLRPGITYHFAVYEISGYNFPVYCTNPALASITMPVEPLTNATNFRRLGTEGNSLWVGWNNGDGTRRVVVARKAAAVTTAPTDGVIYNANTNFGEGSALAEGQYVVYDGTSASVEVKNLEPGTFYHFAVFEYNLSAGSPDYLTVGALVGNLNTFSAPTVQTSNVSASQVLETTAQINFTIGNGTGRMFIMRKNTPVDAAPTNLTYYNYSSIYGQSQLGNGNYIVQRSTGTQAFNVSGLEPATTYHIAVLEYNGSNGPVYMYPAYTTQFTTSGTPGVVPPTVPASAPVVNNIDGNKFSLNWTSGNGAGRIIVARAGSPVSFVPADGTTYTSNAAFGTGTDLGSGQYVLYNQTGQTVHVSNLAPNTTYHFAIFEYNGTGTGIKYGTGSFLSGTAATAAPPTNPSSNVNASFTTTSFTLNWVKGNGDNRIVVVREGAAITSTPVNLTVYPSSNTFRNGSQIGVGEYVVYGNSGNTVTVNGLDANKTYHYSIFEYNGSTGPVYNTSNVVSGMVSTSNPLPVTWTYFKAYVNEPVVTLKWGTALEEDNNYFIVERSHNGQPFQPIDTIAGAGNSNVAQDYTTTDQPPANGQFRYRIRQVDIDGRFSYSIIVQVELKNSSNTLHVFPNPSKDVVTLKWNNNSTATVDVFDVKGTRILQRTLKSGEQLPVQSLTPGVYFLVVSNGTEQLKQQFIKQ